MNLENRKYGKTGQAVDNSLIGSFWNNRELILNMARRDISARYKGAMAGVLWSFVTPLLMLLVYAFVFGFIFKARWNDAFPGSLGFALTIFPGLMLHGLLSDCINRAPTLIIENSSYVKKVIFPLESLAWIVVISALFQFFISMLVLFAFMLAFGFSVPATFPAFIFVVVVFVPFVAGCVWLLSSLGVYIRDMRHGVGILVTVMLFMSPILYPVDFVPESFRWVLNINPLTVVVQQMRNVLILGEPPGGLALLGYFLFSCVFAKLALVWFQRSRSGFADVL